MQLYAMVLRRRDATRVAEFIEAHEQRLAALHRRGVVLASGPFAEGGGLTIIRAASRQDAERVVAEDPFVLNGTHTPELYAWNPWLGPEPGALASAEPGAPRGDEPAGPAG